MKVLFVAMAIMTVCGCERKPTIVGLFGEKIGEKILPSRCERCFLDNATSAYLKAPKMCFPIKETNDVEVTYSVVTNAEGLAEGLCFDTSVECGSIPAWREKVERIRMEVRKKYGEPDVVDSHDEGGIYEMEEESWYIMGRIVHMALLKMDCGSLAFKVRVMTYELAARLDAKSYNESKNRENCRKKWSDAKKKLPQDYVLLVEEMIKTGSSGEAGSYL